MAASSSKSYALYRIECTATGDFYIGITCQSLPIRWRQHVSQSKTGNTHLYRAMRKYGTASFHIEEIGASRTYDDLKKFEVQAIRVLAPAYNHTKGGDGVEGLRHSLHSRAKMSSSRASLWADNSYRQSVKTAQELAWATKSEEQIERHRDRAKRTFQQHRPHRTKAEKVPGPGKGSNMAVKTHCPVGHLYDSLNTHIAPSGSRVCKACKRAGRNAARDRRRRAKNEL